jgi:DNA-binding NarL/FixJ family response regulator
LARGPREFAAQRFRVGPDEYAVFSFPFDAHWTSPSVCSRLTQAELAVTRLVLEGHGNAAIAKTRGTSARTVANQLASIFRKLEVSSRWQLAALCAAPHEAAATAPAASASSERPARSR